MSKVHKFDVLKIMGERSLDVRAFPLDNIKSAHLGKDGWGSVTIAVNNETIHDMLSGKSIIGMFIVADNQQFQALLAELEAK